MQAGCGAAPLAQGLPVGLLATGEVLGAETEAWERPRWESLVPPPPPRTPVGGGVAALRVSEPVLRTTGDGVGSVRLLDGMLKLPLMSEWFAKWKASFTLCGLHTGGPVGTSPSACVQLDRKRQPLGLAAPSSATPVVLTEVLSPRLSHVLRVQCVTAVKGHQLAMLPGDCTASAASQNEGCRGGAQGSCSRCELGGDTQTTAGFQPEGSRGTHTSPGGEAHLTRV